ncbi:hypothetical protein [Paludibacterium yongneupense]|uniref:hypothetical protein n=1 Tax=Paludibacterium yongneupense TaxID=400061 RepID=UPI0004904E63|nr:hypothetical protein [Paludibacterium yongneupense]
MIPIIPQREFPAQRWLKVVVRGLHLVAVIQFCAGVLAQPMAEPSGGLAVLLTGLTLWALDLWQHPDHLRQMVGLSMLIKLLLVAAMMHIPALRLPLLWLIVVWSAVFSHAPSSFRNIRLGGRP